MRSPQYECAKKLLTMESKMVGDEYNFTRPYWLTVNAGVGHQKSDVSQSDRNLYHIEDAGLSVHRKVTT